MTQPYEFLVGQGAPVEDLCWTLQFDGSAMPNPGPASSAAVLWSPMVRGKRNVVVEVAKWSSYSTNNMAEYEGLELGLQWAIKYGIQDLLIEGDSNLVVQQLLGAWRVKHLNIQPIYERIQKLLQNFHSVRIHHVLRSFNHYADRLSKEAQVEKGPIERLHWTVD
jgi:ribonuclease HI/probable phosphoglycerate mutase